MRPAASRSGGVGDLWRLAAAADVADWESGAVQTRLVRQWCEAHGLDGAQIYRPDGGPVASWGVLGKREHGLEHNLVLYWAGSEETAGHAGGAGSLPPEGRELAGILALGLRLRELADESRPQVSTTTTTWSPCRRCTTWGWRSPRP